MTAVTRELRPWSKSEIDSAVAELEQALGTPKGSGNDIRFSICPHCHEVHERNPAFAVNIEKGVYFCFDCTKGGHLSEITGKRSQPIPRAVPVQSNSAPKLAKPEDDRKPADYYGQKLTIAGKGSLSDQYLQSRGIHHASWSDLDLPLKEITSNNWQEAAVYPFVNAAKEIIALQRLFLNGVSFQEKQRRYLGSKSQGIATLKNADKVIVAEGLETGLSARQFLGNDYGLFICGDAGNLATLAGNNSWAIQNIKRVIIAADNDLENTGIEAARQLFLKFPKKIQIYMPANHGEDWNDVLKKGQMEREWL